MKEMVQEVLFETRRHASRPYSPNYPPQTQLNEGGKGILLSYLPFRGIAHLKERWSEYRQVRRKERFASLFISEGAHYIAVASGNQITILLKDSDYQEPVGTFSCGAADTFTCGSWSECDGLLVVVDGSDTIYIIKSNGEEITRITKKHLSVSSSIVGLTMKDDTLANDSYLCNFTVILSDGSFHDIVISKDTVASILSVQALNMSMPGLDFKEVCCWEYSPKLSLFTVVSSDRDSQSISDKGSSSISLWRRKISSKMEPLASAKFEGSYSFVKGYKGPLTPPKSLFSPQGTFLATLDNKGCLFTFKFSEENRSLSKVLVSEHHGSSVITEPSTHETEIIYDVVDFTWWSNDIVTIAKRNGTIEMVGICGGIITLQNDLVYSMPILDRAQQFLGLVFILEITSTVESYGSSEQKGACLEEHVTLAKPNKFDFSKLEWSLVSLVKRSVSEIFDKLISCKRYQSALDFADLHGLDKDDVLKSQWLSSTRGVQEINCILQTIKDPSFIISECVDKIGPTEDATRTLLSLGLRITDCYRFSVSVEDDRQSWDYRMARLRLLQFRDRLETFLGINMGRFSLQEYSRFRDFPLGFAASALAESGKIGALNLLVKRHPYSLMPSLLKVLAAIPETIPMQSYLHLLPGISAPSTTALRNEDWVECEKMVSFINTLPENHDKIHIMTEPILMKCMEFEWPSASELSYWYKQRARDIDELSGQIDNCLQLVDFAIRNGIPELQRFREDIFYLQKLVYSSEDVTEIESSMSLSAWLRLPDYEKFKLLLVGVREDTVIPRLHTNAIPFMKMVRSLKILSHDKIPSDHLTLDKTNDSFMVGWLEEIAQRKLDFCLIIFEETLKDSTNINFFENEAEMMDCALACIYLCNDVDRWSTMSAVLSTLSPMQDNLATEMKQRFKLAEHHVEAGRLLAYYKVPKPINGFLDALADEKSAKQIIRLLLSKFIRSQPNRTDHDWANLWQDLQLLQEKAFSFLDLEYMLIEFCRGLLKAGKFSLARNYLKGTSSVALSTDKGENLVIQAAREYFFSAPSLTCHEIWKAKECLNLFPNSRNVRTEVDVIDALTVRLPNLGVNLLPMAFKQIKDPMDIIKLAITGKGGGYLNADEIIEIAKLLGLSAQEDISAVQEMIAREAAFAGDVQLAFDLCLLLAKKGHGRIWDLCAAIARSQALETMDLKSQKLLLGFALSHCDEESIGELLHEWKNLDMQDQCESLVILTGRERSKLLERMPSDLDNLSESVQSGSADGEAQVDKMKCLISLVAGKELTENGSDQDFFVGDGKFLSFTSSWLPYLLDLREETEFGKRFSLGSVSSIQHISVRTRVLATILSWLANNSLIPRDDLIASLAKSVMETPVTSEDDVIGCSILLNLIDASHGVEIIEEQLKVRGNHHEFSSLMSMGMIYSLLHNHSVECENPTQRRELLLSKFQEKQKSLSTEEWNNAPEAQSTFWSDWSGKLEQRMQAADELRILKKIVPGVDTSRFFSGDREYIQSVVFSLIESVKVEKKHILKDALLLAHTYGLHTRQVLLYFLRNILVSEFWSVDDILSETSHFKDEILIYPEEAISTISISVYPDISGMDKQRIAYIYSFLSECYLKLEESKELSFVNDQGETRFLELAHFCQIAEQECNRVSFIRSLNFKNIAGLQCINSSCFNDEVCAHVNVNNVDALATMVQNFGRLYDDVPLEGLISWKYVYTHYILSSLASLEGKADGEIHFQCPEDLMFLINEIVQTYDACGKRIRVVEPSNILGIVKRFFTIILLVNQNLKNFPCDTIGKECVLLLINFWLRLMNDVDGFLSVDISGEKFYSRCSQTCLQVLSGLLDEGMLSPNLGWFTVVNCVKSGLVCDASAEIVNFLRAMMFSGCKFKAIACLFSEVLDQFPDGLVESSSVTVNARDLPNIYVIILDNILQGMDIGSCEQQNLNQLLLSLSKLEGNLENLKEVRHAVWNRMSLFSENLQVPNHLRLNSLMLMQCISGKKKTFGMSSEDERSDILPWDGWDDFQDTNADLGNSNELAPKDVTSRFSNTLVSLKSSQLVSSISPSLEIAPEDILSIDSAVSCFLRITESAVTASHVKTLLSVLSEFEGHFTSGKNEIEYAEISDTVANWNSDDWDEGWENFQDESTKIEKNGISDTTVVHPLHVCWRTVVAKMVAVSMDTDILRLLDRNASKNYELLLDEDDTLYLVQTAQDKDCFLALKIALLMPYEAIQLQCLDVVENKLKQGGIPENISRDISIFFLFLSSGILSKIITKTSFGATFSFLCYMVGYFCHQFQETQSSTTKNSNIIQGQKLDSVFSKLLFPCFVSELVKADQHILAGVLVTRFMHANAALSLINISEISLITYLQRHLQERNGVWDDISSCESLTNNLTNLSVKSEILIKSALSLLGADVR